VLYGRDLCGLGGTGKAEAAKQSGAGIGPKRAQENQRQKKSYLLSRRESEGGAGLHNGKKLWRISRRRAVSSSLEKIDEHCSPKFAI